MSAPLFAAAGCELLSGLFYCWRLLRNNNIAINLQRFTSSYDRVANLVFLKPGFEIPAFFNEIWLFMAFFCRKSLALEKHCLSCMFIANLF